MNRFVVWLGLPALLFSLTANADWTQIWQPGFLLAFTGGMFAVFLITLPVSLEDHWPLVALKLVLNRW